MAKPKKAKGGKQEQEASMCTCEHPYNCDCGNRPPRPSTGHRWDPESQAWGGKGHKQKGASGQTASVSQQATTTAVGKTQVAQWQRLPSKLLEEYCRRQKRPQPKYKNVEKKDKRFKYRVILPDTKDANKDLFFVPAGSVENEEQAKEEGALLALLQLTPSLPHERKLPEPYRTTWLNAVDAQKEKDAVSKEDKSNLSAGGDSEKRADAGGGAAKASSNLVGAKSYSSLAEKRKQDEEKRRERNARIRRHEAVRLANQNHPVFMSARIRSQIEQLLRGDYSGLHDDEEDDEMLEDAAGGEIDEVQAYVEQRLTGEGFTLRQARIACQENAKSNQRSASVEDDWDNVYEGCLQWLLVHLDENQLPEGFDPREGTLDVVAPPTLSVTDEDKAVATRYGLTLEEGSLIRRLATKDKMAVEDVLWSKFCDAAGETLVHEPPGQVDSDRCLEILQEELEVLDAMFGSECASTSSEGTTTLSLPISESDLSLLVSIRDGVYPSTHPRLLVAGTWPSSGLGTFLHVELVKFMSANMTVGEPMIFDIHAHVQTLLQDVSNLARSERPNMLSKPTEARQISVSAKESVSMVNANRQSKPSLKRRPRERGHFWSVSPADAPPAVAFPLIDKTLSRTRKSLPANGARGEFLAALAEAQAGGRVLLCTGDTGCGKSTQLPQFVLEQAPGSAKIVVAQPRRIAATGVAARVAEERGESQPGVESVGYVVRGDSAMCKRTRILFCTTGVLLRQLQNEGALDCITHIMVDEVHERSLDSDVLLALLKEALPKNPHLCVILMSATLDADKFAAYWNGRTPQIHIPGRTFPVVDFTLEDVLSLTQYMPPRKRKGGNTPHSNPESEHSDNEDSVSPSDGEEPEKIKGISIADLVKRIDETNVNYELLARLVMHLVQNKMAGTDGSILVFLSGAPEISKAMETIKRCARGMPIHLLPLHGGLQSKEQSAVFRSPPTGLTKIVLSTNIAETSITIPDCTIVIDSAREKQSSYDPINRMPLLVEQFGSKANLKQRRGRAGRVREGVCYKLISRATLAKLSEHSEPEIRRCALDQTLLSLLFLGVGKGFMETLLDPPTPKSVDAAISSLAKLGAVENEPATDDLKLTPLGMHLAGIPAPPTVGKMLVMGAILGCRSAALAMAAGITAGRSPFLRIDDPRSRWRNSSDSDPIADMKAERVIDERVKLFKIVGASDHALLAAIFDRWEAAGTLGGRRKEICESLGLSFNGMRDIYQLVKQLDSSLEAAGYSATAESNRNCDSGRIIRACLVSAMAPGQLVKVVRPATTYHETAEGAREKDGEARTLKFFIRSGCDGFDASNQQAGSNEKASEERVFIHPSSFNFQTGSYSCPWLVYHSLVRTSKPFLRDVTECSAYSLLLFGGDLEVKASDGVIAIDSWVRLAANARIGSLVGGLRRKVDEMLSRKVSDPSFDIGATEEMRLIVKLVKTDGMGI